MPNPTNLTDVNGTLFFTADDGAHGRELWKSDGTAAGTVLVKDINPGGPGSDPASLTVVNGRLFFTAADAAGVRRLFVSDGTGPGTVAVQPAGQDFGAQGVWGLTRVGRTLFFQARGGLWKTDGTSAGTVEVKTTRGASLSAPLDLTAVGNSLFLVASAGPGQSGLWRTDGTAAGTTLVKSFALAGGLPMPTVYDLTDVNGTLYFVVNAGTRGTQLWKSDGTAAGTQMVLSGGPGGPGAYRKLANVNGVLYFVAGGEDGQLWRSDGTAAGTRLVQTFHGEHYGDGVLSGTVANGALYLVTDDGTHGFELWKVDTPPFPRTPAGGVQRSGRAAPS
jgi:ELWxxDGT repeat protein